MDFKFRIVPFTATKNLGSPFGNAIPKLTVSQLKLYL